MNPQMENNLNQSGLRKSAARFLPLKHKSSSVTVLYLRIAVQYLRLIRNCIVQAFSAYSFNTSVIHKQADILRTT